MKSASNLKKWVDDEYSKVETDPWGLDWRPSQQYRYAKVIEALNKHAGKKDLSIADIGCATGVFTNYIYDNCRSNNIDLVGMDISPLAVTRASQSYPHINFIESDIQQFSEKYTQSQDVIICLETLYYIESDKRKAAVNQLVSSLKDKGIIMISSLNQKHPYLGKDELLELVSDLDVLEVSTIYLKPLIKVERFVIKLDRLLRRIKLKTNILKNIFRFIFGENTVRRLSGFFSKISKDKSASHVLVVARIRS